MGQDRKDLVQQFFVCMRAGASHVEELIGLFADEATYTEPFDPAGPRTHEGRDAIAEVLRSGAANRPADFELELHRIDIEPDVVKATWTCRSAVFGGAIPGRDTFFIEQGKIKKLVTELDGPPG